MSEKTSKTVRLIYGIVFGVFTAVVGGLLIWQTLDIYFSASSEPFTREKVGAALSKICVPLYIWLAGVVAGFILWEIFPVATQKRQPMPEDYTIKRLKKRLPASADGGLNSDLNAIKKEENTLFILKLVWAIMWVAIAIYGIVYFCLPTSFPRSSNADVADATHNVAKMALHIMPFAFVALIYGCVVAIYERYSAKKQMPLVKKLVANGGKAGGEVAAKQENAIITKIKTKAANKKFIWIVRGVLALLAVALIIWGICDGGMAYVLANAIKLCTSCIGLG